MKIFCCSEKKHHPLYFFVMLKISHNLRILLNNKIYSIGKKVSLNSGIFLPLQKTQQMKIFCYLEKKHHPLYFFVLLKTSHYLRILLNNKIYSIGKKVSLNSGMFLQLQKTQQMKIFCCLEKKHHPLYFFVLLKTSHYLRILLNNKIYSIGKKVSLNSGIFLPLQKNIVDENILLLREKTSSTIFFVVLKTSHNLRILLNNKIYSIGKKVSLNCGMFLPLQKFIWMNNFSILREKISSNIFFVMLKISHNIRIFLNNKIFFIGKKYPYIVGYFLPLQKSIR